MNLLQQIKSQKKDALLWFVAETMKDINEPFEKAKATDKIIAVLSKIPNQLVRNMYAESIAGVKEYGIKLRQLTAVVSAEEEWQDENIETGIKKLPTWMDREELEENGFCEVQNDKIVGYYGLSNYGGVAEITNFIVNPIFHVDGKVDESRHIFEVRNRVKSAVLDVQSKVFISLETFQSHLVTLPGSFQFYGSKSQLLRIANQLLPKFPLCFEITQLGWQDAGFFAFINMVYIPKDKDQEAKLINPSKWGMIDIDTQHYLIPAASDVYKSLDKNKKKDAFSSIRPLCYVQAPITFEQWAKQMKVVYDDKGLTGIAFVFMTAYRDIVFAVNGNCPHLYGYGGTSSGKSQWMTSIYKIFYKDRAAFNLNSGTEYAFFEYMQSFVNCPAWLNEFNDKTCSAERNEAIKGVFDGEGRVRGKMGQRNGTETQTVDGTLMLSGQYLSQRDDNSNVNRSLVEAFAERKYTEQQSKEFQKLRQWQDQGLTSLLIDVLAHREIVKKEYYEKYNEILSTWTRATTGDFNQRIFQNWCHLSAMWQIFSSLMKLPVSWPKFDEMAYGKAVEYSRFVRSSDTLTDFWNTVAFLLDDQQIKEGWDFRITVQHDIKLRNSDGAEYTKTFDEPRKLLYLRLPNIHKLYEQVCRSRGRNDALTFENLKHYFSNRSYYIGQTKQTLFSRWIYKDVEKSADPLLASSVTVASERKKDTTNTSAYIFDYDLLGCELERVESTNL